MKTLIITADPPLPKEKILSHLTSTKTTKKADALRSMITLLSQNVDLSDYTTTAIKEICQNENTQLKKIFYLFLELIPKTDRDGKMLAEVLLIANQVRKDLEHPNEYVRGRVLQFVCTLMYEDIVELMYKPVINSLGHSHYYVRRNAVLCLTRIYERFGNRFVDVPELIRKCMVRESNPYCLRQCYASLRSFRRSDTTGGRQQCSTALVNGTVRNSIIDMPFSSMPEELLSIVLDDNPSEELLWECVNSNRCKFRAAVLLLRFKRSEARAIGIILDVIRVEPSLKEAGLQCISRTGCRSLQLCDLLTLLDANVKDVLFELVYRIADVSSYPLILEHIIPRIRQSYTDQDFLIFLIEQAIHIREHFNVYSDTLGKAVQPLVLADPEVAFAAVRLLTYDPVSHKYLLSILDRIRYGRIFRRAVNVVASNNKLANEFLAKIDDLKTSKELRSSVYFGVPVSLALYKFYKEGALERNVVCEKILELIKQGKKECCYDYSGYGIMTGVLADMLSDDLPGLSAKPISSGDDNGVNDINDVNDENVCANSTDNVRTGVKTSVKTGMTTGQSYVDGLFRCSLIKEQPLAEHTEQIRSFICPADDSRDIRCHQMTGYSDHLYIEAIVDVSRLSIGMDMLVVNQTGRMVQNILFEFTTSCNITQNFVTLPLSLNARSIIRLPFTFTLRDIFNGFITGSVNYTIRNVCHVINMSTVSFRVNDFLQSRQLGRDEFKAQWLLLEWENSYTSRFRCEYAVNRVLDMITEHLRTYVVDVKTDRTTFVVANMVCTTFLGEDVLLNVKIRREDMVYVDCRMRSRQETLVKSLSVVFSDLLRVMKE